MTDEKKNSDAPQDAIEEFEGILSEVGGPQYKVSISRFDPRTGDKEWVAKHPAEGFTVEEIKERYGGGKFELRILNEKGRYAGGKVVRIAAPHKDLSEPEESEEFDTEAEIERRVEERTRELREKSVLEVVIEGQREIARELREMRRPPAEAHGLNPLELVQNMHASWAAMIQPYQNALLERALEKEGPDSTEVLGQMLNILSQGIELGRETGGDGSGYGSVIRELGKPLVEILERESRRRSAGASAAPTPTLPNPPNGAAPVVDRAPESNEDAPAWLPIFRPFVPQLIAWAQQGKDPELTADWVLGELPDNYLDPIGRQLDRGDEFLTEFEATMPQAAEHMEWLRPFFSRMADGLVYVEESPEEPAGDGSESEGEEGRTEVAAGASSEGEPEADE